MTIVTNAMRTTCLTNAAELDSIATSWNGLAGAVPFRRHEWLATWWRHYGEGAELAITCVWDDDQLVAIAPFLLERCRTKGRILRLLGTGEVCSDYLSILCRGGHEEQIVSLVAERLLEDDRWDALHLDGIDAQDSLTPQLVAELARQGCLVYEGAGPNCWRLQLPKTWTEYEARLSKSHRKQTRRLIERVFNSDRAELHTASNVSDFAIAQQILIDLHQRRRQALGEPGCFASPSFLAFHQDVMKRLLASGLLRLHWLELDGRPAAAEYHVADGGVIYGYQAGVNPELLDEEPGRLAAIATLRLAVEQGFTAFDFLRGDEPYKAHFRAEPRPSVRYRLAPRRPAARLRHRAWNVVESVKEQWRDREAGKRTLHAEI